MPRTSATIALRILTEFARSRRVLMLWILFPAALLIIFGWVRADKLGAGPAFAATAPGILIGAGLFFSCLGGPVSVIAAERERYTLRRLLAAPVGGYSYLLGVFIAHLAVAVGQVGVVYGITYLIGGRFAGSMGLAVVVLILSVLAYTGWVSLSERGWPAAPRTSTGRWPASASPCSCWAEPSFPLKTCRRSFTRSPSSIPSIT